MPQTVTYEILDEPDGRFSVVARMEPDRIYRRDDLTTLAEAQEWIEGLRGLMAACGAPVVEVPGEAMDASPGVRASVLSEHRTGSDKARLSVDMVLRRGGREAE